MIFVVTAKGESKAMTEYIVREQTISAIMRDCPELVYYNKKEAISCIESISAADVAPVVHGYWTQVDDTKCRCSNCDIIALIGLYPHGDKNYCPNCGARMDVNKVE